MSDTNLEDNKLNSENNDTVIINDSDTDSVNDNDNETDTEEFNLNLIFLPDKYKKKNKWIFKNDLVEKLENLGIKVVYTSDIEVYTKNEIYTFNDNNYPNINTLYIHLFNGAYYCEKYYSSKKLEKEREIIFLLSGKLGVSEIKYKIESSNFNVSGFNASANIEKFKIGGSYDKKINSSKEKSYIERYSNRGAPAYTLCENLDQVELNLKYNFKKLNPKVFSYNFYKSSNKLTTFVYKRFNFRMVSLNYDTESEDIYDKTLEVKILLMSYGLGMKIRNYIYTMQKISYDMVFFSDQELRLELDKIIQLKEDPFYQTREIYDSMNNKDIAVYSITQYVREYSKNLKYNVNNQQNNFSDKLNIWIENNPEDFIETCHTFMTTYQIETWLLSKLKLNNNEEYIEPEKKSYNICGINEIKKDNYQKYKKRLLLENSSSKQLDKNDIDIYNCSDLDIAKLEQKLQKQQKIIEETKKNISILEQKNSLNESIECITQTHIKELQLQLLSQNKINKEMNEKLDTMNHYNTGARAWTQVCSSYKKPSNEISSLIRTEFTKAEQMIKDMINNTRYSFESDIIQNTEKIKQMSNKIIELNHQMEELKKNIDNIQSISSA